MSVDSALGDGIDLTAVLAAFRDQESYGHTAESDAERKLSCFGEDLILRSMELRDVMIAGDRQNLDVAMRRAAKLGAMALATMRRIRREQSRKKEPST